jgi:hypothetical protein
VRHVLAAVCLLFLVCYPAAAQDPAGPPHVRTESVELRRVMADGVRGSTTFRALVDAIDRTDLVVYVRLNVQLSRTLDGRIGLAGAIADARFLVIELACPRSNTALVAILAHELQHAVEIARAPWVIDAQTLGEYYSDIGVLTGEGSGRQTFETLAARSISERVRHELTGSAIASR